MRTALFGLISILGSLLVPDLDAQGRVPLVGSVVDSTTGEPLAGVMVYTVDGYRTDSDRNGRFRLRGPKDSPAIVLLRRIGFAPRAIPVPLLGSDTINVGTVKLTPLAVALDSVQILADLVARNPKLSEFYRRRRNGMGSYLTRGQIFERNPLRTSDLLRTMPGVTISCSVQGLGSCVPVSTRNLARPCPMALIIDGQEFAPESPSNPAPFTIDELPPAWVAGIEIYRGSATTPLELQVKYKVCGAIVIWTGGDYDSGSM